MTCQLTGARRLHMVLEALLIAVTLAKHLKFNGFKNFEGLLCQERVLWTRCCAWDEGRPFGAGLQEQASNSRKLLQSERLRWWTLRSKGVR